MKCLLKSSPQEFENCCSSCEAKEVCKDVCPVHMQRSCKYRKEERRQMRKRKITYRWLMDVIIIALLVLLIVWMGNLNMMAEDMLNALSETRQEIDGLGKKKQPVDNLTDGAIKTAVQKQDSPTMPSEREYITRVCMAEAGNDLEGCMAVAQTISDRANLWDMTPYEVAIQEGQYAAPRQGALYQEAAAAVSSVFDEGVRVFDSNVTHFHSEDIDKPYWTDGKKFIGSRGGNRFYL